MPVGDRAGLVDSHTNVWFNDDTVFAHKYLRPARKARERFFVRVAPAPDCALTVEVVGLAGRLIVGRSMDSSSSRSSRANSLSRFH